MNYVSCQALFSAKQRQATSLLSQTALSFLLVDVVTDQVKKCLNIEWLS
jgi:hypothetical protein